MKTSELIGPALDWAVAKALYGGRLVHYRTWLETKNEYWKGRDCSFAEVNEYRILSADFDGVTTVHIQHYSTHWAQGGPIIEQEIHAFDHMQSDRVCAIIKRKDLRNGGFNHGYGPTPLVAAMRAFVASKLGDEVEIPEELK